MSFIYLLLIWSLSLVLLYLSLLHVIMWVYDGAPWCLWERGCAFMPLDLFWCWALYLLRRCAIGLWWSCPTNLHSTMCLLCERFDKSKTFKHLGAVGRGSMSCSMETILCSLLKWCVFHFLQLGISYPFHANTFYSQMEKEMVCSCCVMHLRVQRDMGFIFWLWSSMG